LNATNAGLSSLIVDQMKELDLPVDRGRAAAQLKDMIADARQWRGSCVKDVKVQY
jgi:hypothetical protein